MTATENDNWLAMVEYDAACKYTVHVQAKYNTVYCGEVEREGDSDMSKPVYFGKVTPLYTFIPFKTPSH